MSLGNVSIRMIRREGMLETYEVLTSDFSGTTARDEIIGILQIDTLEGDYTFQATGPLENEKVIAPNIFSLSAEKAAELLKTTYAGCTALPWSKRINWQARNIIEARKSTRS